MPRLRRYLPPLLILLPVIFICGKLLLTPVHDDQWNEPFHYGWPWEYQIVNAVYNRQTSEYDVGQTFVFDLKSLLEDFAILLGAVVVCGGRTNVVVASQPMPFSVFAPRDAAIDGHFRVCHRLGDDSSRQLAERAT